MQGDGQEVVSINMQQQAAWWLLCTLVGPSR